MRECACGFSCSKLDPRTAVWHRAHELVHLVVFPNSDASTIANLRTLVQVFEAREAKAADLPVSKVS